LTRPSSKNKVQAHPHVTEGATFVLNPQLSKENFKEKEKLFTGPDGGLTGRLTTSVEIIEVIIIEISIDWVSRNVYWTDSTKDTLEVGQKVNSFEKFERKTC
jgi:hypothetical protein